MNLAFRKILRNTHRRESRGATMQRQPSVVGLKLCREAIVAEGNRNVTLVNCFRKLNYSSFPTKAYSFTVCVVLTDGMGDGELALSIVSLEDMDAVWSRSWKASLHDPLSEVWFLLPVSDCAFPSPGRYQVALLIDGEPVAQSVLQILNS